MAIEVEQHLGRERYERRESGDREDYRNGSYLRHFLAEMGDLIVRIPRTRKGFISKVLEAYQRRSRSVDHLMMACFVLGMSTSPVGWALPTDIPLPVRHYNAHRQSQLNCYCREDPNLRIICS